jgi:hypothetical protein
MSKLSTMIASICLVATLDTASFAQSADEVAYKKAYEAALRLHQEARSYQNGWTVTTVALKSAKEAADKSDFASAVTFARQAEVLAQASVDQSKTQKSVWQEAVVK